MLGCFLPTVSPRPQAPSVRRRFRPRLEALETRDCPSGGPLSITSFTTAVVTGKVVHLSGQIQDTNPNPTVTLNFTGAASGTTQASANGSFAVDVTADSLGSVMAVATDNLQATSDPAKAAIVCAAPQIQGFTAVHGLGDYWTLSGTIVAQTAGNVLVNFGGLTVLVNQHTTSQSDGTFTITIDLQGQTGPATAQAIDCWNQPSNVATWVVS
jgi:hypothetical protein